MNLQPYDSKKGLEVHIVDDFISDLTVSTGSYHSESSIDPEEMDENIQMLYSTRSYVNPEMNILNQTEIIVKDKQMDNDLKVKILAVKIKDLVSDIQQLKQQLNQVNQEEQM